mgnify:CR=1 FL=1
MQIGKITFLHATAQLIDVTGELYTVLLHYITGTTDRRCSIVTMFHNREAGSGNCKAGSCRNIECVFSVTSGSYDIYRSKFT